MCRIVSFPPSKITLSHCTFISPPERSCYLSLLSSYSHAVPFAPSFYCSLARSLFSRSFIHNFFAGTRSYRGGVSIWNSTTTAPLVGPLRDTVDTKLYVTLSQYFPCFFQVCLDFEDSNYDGTEGKTFLLLILKCLQQHRLKKSFYTKHSEKVLLSHDSLNYVFLPFRRRRRRHL